MFKFIEFLKKRPSDKQIRIGRTVFGLIIILLLGIYFNKYSVDLPASMASNELYVKYSLFILGLVPIIVGAFDPCFAKRKYVKIIQIVFGIALIIIGNNISIKGITTETKTEVTKSGSIDLATITNKQTKSVPINVGFLIALLGIFPLLAGITGKCITQKCFKFGEIITKIRV